MKKRRQSMGGVLARGLAWTLIVVLALSGLIALFAAPLSGLLVSNALSSRGLGPVSLKITRLDLGGVSIRQLKMLGGAASLGEVDVTYNWRELFQGRLETLRIDGLETKITWAADGKVSVGGYQVFPRPAPPSSPPETPQKSSGASTAPILRSIVITNARALIALPRGEIALPFSLSAAQDDNGRAADFTLAATGPNIDLKAAISAVEPTGKPAQGTASLASKITGLDLPGLATKITSDANFSFSFDAKGAQASDSRAELAFILDKTEQKNPLVLGLGLGLDLTKPLRIALSGIDSRLFTFSIDRTLPIPRAKIDAGLTIGSGSAELRALLKGWAQVPLANTAGEQPDVQDFNIERIGLTARQIPLGGGAADGSVMLTELKGPLAVAEGRMAATFKATAMADLAQRLESTMAAAFRLDGLSLSFDVKTLWLEAESLKLGSALAQGINRAELNPAAKSSQQINVVFNTAGGSSLVTDLALTGALPKIITGSSIASLTLPRITLGGYLSQAGDVISGTMKLGLSDGRLAHPTLGLADISAELGYNGKVLSGPASARLLEAADPSRPKSLDRLGALLKSDITFDSDSIDIKGKITSKPGIEIGTFSYAQNGTSPAQASLKIPPRTWAAEPSFMEAFGPLAALTNTTGTFGIEVAATMTPKAVTGTTKMTLADFGFASGALSMKGINAAFELDQIWPPRAAKPQRLSFGQLLAGVPFTEGDVTVALPGDGTAVVTQANIKLAGGSVTGNDLLIPFDGREQAFGLDVANVDLGTLVAAFSTDGLAATGKLAGRLPLRLQNSRLYIDKGRLVGRNGNIRYAPAKAPAALAQGGAIVMQALADFKYDEVAANLNGDITKDLAISIGLKGRNPGLYGGYPIEFNLNLDGPLNRLVRDGLSGYRIPDDIKTRLEQIGAGSAPKGEN